MILQDLSPTQLNSVLKSDARINIWEGAVRSGKSHAAVIRFLDYIVHGPPGMLIAVGKTNAALKRNFVDPLLEILGVDVGYYSGKQEVQLYGRTIVLVGANDERAEGKIRGNTYAGAYVDEITLLPESFWITLLARLSVPGAKLFGTTNPDSPFHWLKKNYIDRREELDLKTFQFTIEDNPSLTKQFKDNLKREFRGLWFQRYIEGKWVLAEGVVYDFFDEGLHCIDFAPTHSRYYVCGVDYGTTNPCAYTLMGYDPASHPNLWVEDEFYWDSREHNRQKTDTEYAEDLLKFLGQRNVKHVIIDPSAASFKAELIHHGVSNLLDADNEVLDGIRIVSKFLSNGTLKVCKRCRNLIREFGTYAWDEKSIKLGEDKPLKTNDHCFAAGAVVTTDYGPEPIENIREGDFVLTPIGYRRVLLTHVRDAEVCEYSILGKSITCTPEHRFYTANRGWISASDLIQSDMFYINLLGDSCRTQSSGMGTNITEAKHPAICAIEDITEDTMSRRGKITISTAIFGLQIMERFHPDTIFITSMRTPHTTILAISNVYQLLNTYPRIWQILLKHKKKLEEFALRLSNRLQKNGTHLQKEEIGIKNTGLMPIKKDSPKNMSAPSVVKNSNQRSSPEQNFVQITVNQSGDDNLGLIMSLESVNAVLKHSQSTSIPKPNTALEFAHGLVIGKRAVYNLTVDGMPTFFVEDILVHNCLDALRYTIFSHFRHIYDGTGGMDPEVYRRWKAEQGWF